MLLASPFLNDLASRAGLPFPYVQMAPTQIDGSEGIYWINFGHSVTALAFIPPMLCMARYTEWSVNRALSWKPLRFLGRMSYTVYVWHTLVYFVVLDLLGGNESLGEKWRVPILAVITIVACLPVFYGVERRSQGEAEVRIGEPGARPQHRQDGAGRAWAVRQTGLTLPVGRQC